MTEEGTNNKTPDIVSDTSSNASTLTSKSSYRGRGNTRGGNFQGRGRYHGGNQYTTTQSKGVNKDLTTLKSISEGPRRDQFIQFQSELEQFVLKTFSGPDDIAVLIKDLEDPSKTLRKQMPIMENVKEEIRNQGLDEIDDKIEIELITQSINELYRQEMKLYATRRQQLRSNRSKLFGTIWSQCTPTLQSEIINLKEYDEKRKEYECLWLLENLKLLSSGIDSKQNASYTAYEVSSAIYFLRQQQNESLDSYYRRFLSIIKTAKLMGISYDQHEKIIENVKDNCPSDTDEEIKKKVSDRYEAMIFLMRADKFRYENLWVDLRINMSQGDDRYPVDINLARNILYNYSKPSMNNNNK